MVNSQVLQQQINAELAVLRQIAANFDLYDIDSNIKLDLYYGSYTQTKMAAFLSIIVSNIISHVSFQAYSDKTKSNLLSLYKICQQLTVERDPFAEAIEETNSPVYFDKTQMKLLINIICNYHKHPTSSCKETWKYFLSHEKRSYFHAIVNNINYSIQQAIKTFDKSVPSLGLGYKPEYHQPATNSSAEYSSNPFSPI